MIRPPRLIAAYLGAVLALCSFARHSHAAVPGTAELDLYVGETITLPRPGVRRVLVGKSAVISAAVLGNGDVVVVAHGTGATTLSILNDRGNAELWAIRVLPVDMQRIAREIAGFLGNMPNVSTRTIGDKIIVDGSDLSEAQLFKLAEMAKHYPEVVNLAAFQKDRAWEKMVLIDVQVIEVARNHTRDFGIRWQGTLPGPHVEPYQGRIGVTGAIDSTISLLESAGQAVVLADPQLAARSGKKASFLVGGEIPYQAINQDGSAQITFKKFGVELDVTPVALDSGAILSSVRASVSEPDASLNPLSGVPGLRSREADTWFNVRSGETMVIAGLLQRNAAKTEDRVPGLGAIPILGHLFKGRRAERRETELVIFVTARIVTPDDPESVRRRQGLQDKSGDTISHALSPTLPGSRP